MPGPNGLAIADRQSDLRCERKYPLSAAELVELRWWQRRHGQAFRRAYPSRIVNSVYFDSPDWDSVADNLDGSSSRTKCRLRWYGELGAAPVATFEAKRRRQHVGRKEQQPVDTAVLGLGWRPTRDLYRRLRPLLRPELRPWLDQNHQPVLYVRYDREYYASAKGVRITVDTGIAYALLHGRPLERLRPVRGTAAAVLEVKFPSARRAEVEDALERLPFRATRFSKYVLGIDRLLSA